MPIERAPMPEAARRIREWIADDDAQMPEVLYPWPKRYAPGDGMPPRHPAMTQDCHEGVHDHPGQHDEFTGWRCDCFCHGPCPNCVGRGVTPMFCSRCGGSGTWRGLVDAVNAE